MSARTSSRSAFISSAVTLFARADGSRSERNITDSASTTTAMIAMTAAAAVPPKINSSAASGASAMPTQNCTASRRDRRSARSGEVEHGRGRHGSRGYRDRLAFSTGPTHRAQDRASERSHQREWAVHRAASPVHGPLPRCGAYCVVSELSDEKTRPMVALPDWIVFFVTGPPVSWPWLRNWPNWMPYVFSRPSWQNGRCGHSAGPASDRRLAGALRREVGQRLEAVLVGRRLGHRERVRVERRSTACRTPGSPSARRGRSAAASSC